MSNASLIAVRTPPNLPLLRARPRRAASALSSQRGMTFLELIISCTILLVLAGMALPIARYTALREREKELRFDLREMRDAIDRYKELADHQQIRTAVGSEGYPPDLDTLVKGVPLAGVGGATGKTIRFLRRIPVDPMTKSADWGLRSVQDDPDSQTWGGSDVFDVYSKSTGTALNGTKYSDW